jgi:hypothetical protein
MAKIFGISNCTRFLVDGIKPINGKKLSTFAEIDFFFNNYSIILSHTKKIITKQQDELISSLNTSEILLNNQIAEDISRQRREEEAHIIDLQKKIEMSESFLRKGYHFVDYVIAKIKTYAGIYPSREAIRELRNIQDCKTKAIKLKPLIIKDAEKNINDAKWFLTFNTSFFMGAQGEEQVIQILSALSDEYHILNDVCFDNGDFKTDSKSIETYQIDHVVIGPTGLFLLETKNWKVLDSEEKIQKLAQQMRRSNNALRKYLRIKYGDVIPWIQGIAVSIHGNQSGLRISHIDIITPDRLFEHIVNRKKSLLNSKIDKLVKIIPSRK